MVVTLLSDFGLRDEFAGVMEAVIEGVAPGVRVIHLTHGVPAHDVRAGALALANALPHVPVGVHVAVVDPTVGSERRAVVLVTGDGRLLVGPDNGVLVPAAEGAGGISAAYAITATGLLRQPVSPTFHGRDVFAPVAGHLAAGVEPSAVGPPIDVASLARVVMPGATFATGRIEAAALVIDRFGNVALNLSGADLDRHGLGVGARIEVVIGAGRYLARRARTFADVRRGELVVYDDSSGRAALAMNAGSVADVADVSVDDPISLRLA